MNENAQKCRVEKLFPILILVKQGWKFCMLIQEMGKGDSNLFNGVSPLVKYIDLCVLILSINLVLKNALFYARYGINSVFYRHIRY